MRQAGLLEALAELVQSAIRGDPQAALLWVGRSQRHLAGALAERGFTASRKLVGRLLRRLGFSLQANGLRVRLWKRELQAFANQSGLAITVTHHPPGASKSNRIEHRLFALITPNRRGQPLLSDAVIVQLIGAATTSAGLAVHCRLDDNDYPKAIKVADAEMAEINTKPDDFHGEWNHTISPTQPSPTRLLRLRPLRSV